jgi:hypothetical protein
MVHQENPAKNKGGGTRQKEREGNKKDFESIKGKKHVC